MADNKIRKIYVGIADARYWTKQPVSSQADLESVARSLQTSPHAYVIGNYSGNGEMHYSHDAATFLGAIEVIHALFRGNVIITDFSEGHPFHDLDGHAKIDTRARELLEERLGVEKVRLASF